MTLDELDLAIIRELQKNGRSSNRRVADVLSVSEGTIRQRLAKLESAKLMRLGVVSDADALGLLGGVYVRLRTLPRRAKEIADTLAGYESCVFVGLTVGRYDIIAFFNALTREEVIEIVDTKITPLSGVLGIDVREPVGYVKHRFDLIHIP